MALNQDLVRKLFRYDPETGVLTRLSTRDRAGWLSSIGYWYVSINSKKYLVHRVIWLLVTGEWPAADIDHRDGNPANNRWENLRAVTHSQNLMNQKMNCKNTSGVKGVCFDKARNKWAAEIKIGGRKLYLGRFQTMGAAAAARLKATAQFHGEYAGVGRL